MNVHVDTPIAAMSPMLRAKSGAVNYLEPKGDPGLYGPDSVAWKVHANPIALAIGGVAAVILELAEPRVRTGVWEHSTFRKDPLSRMQRTGDAAMITTYGPTTAAKARIAMVTRMHQRVGGVTPEGQAYQAMDDDLLTWVHVTAGYGFLNAYVRHVEALSLADQDRYYAEGAKLGRAFGAKDVPTSVAEVEACVQAMRPKLRPHPIIGEFLDIVSTTSPLGLAGRILQPFVVEASIDLLPAWARTELELP
ncbi:MAG: oxygenase MpaB family protein, partial [Phenylobacterium sp.]